MWDWTQIQELDLYKYLYLKPLFSLTKESLGYSFVFYCQSAVSCILFFLRTKMLKVFSTLFSLTVVVILYLTNLRDDRSSTFSEGKPEVSWNTLQSRNKSMRWIKLTLHLSCYHFSSQIIMTAHNHQEEEMRHHICENPKCKAVIWITSKHRVCVRCKTPLNLWVWSVSICLFIYDIINITT